MKRILVIEDDPDLLEILKAWLVKAGYEVMGASTGTGGMATLRKMPADLIVTDMFLPDATGTSIVMDVRDEFPGAKVIAMSGGGASPVDYLHLAKLLGASEVFSKPFEKASFLNAVQGVLQ